MSKKLIPLGLFWIGLAVGAYAGTLTTTILDDGIEANGVHHYRVRVNNPGDANMLCTVWLYFKEGDRHKYTNVATSAGGHADIGLDECPIRVQLADEKIIAQ
jgi:hypothetical protein